MTSKKLVSIFAKEESVNSYEFYKVLNKIRLDEGANTIKHSRFIGRVKKVIGDNQRGTMCTPSRQSEEIEVFDLTQRQMLLIGMRESQIVGEKVMDWLEHLIAKVSQLEQEKINRANASLNYVEQNKVLQETRRADGKETMPYHYSNEANLVNRIVLGMTAKAYRKDNEFDQAVNLRDTLSIVELECVASLESTNKELIKIGMDYQLRKEMLLKVFKRDFAGKLIDEQIRLEA
jgi:phage regulator Rha-like protein